MRRYRYRQRPASGTRDVIWGGRGLLVPGGGASSPASSPKPRRMSRGNPEISPTDFPGFRVVSSLTSHGSTSDAMAGSARRRDHAQADGDGRGGGNAVGIRSEPLGGRDAARPVDEHGRQGGSAPRQGAGGEARGGTEDDGPGRG